MPGIRETRRLPYSAEQMFDLVADVARYGEFLPWVIATRVRSNSETEMVADMVVGFKAIRESFTSRVSKTRPKEIDVHYVDGPLSDLDNVWTFRAVDDHTCEIDFLVDFTFKNRLFEMLAGHGTPGGTPRTDAQLMEMLEYEWTRRWSIPCHPDDAIVPATEVRITGRPRCKLHDIAWKVDHQNVQNRLIVR